MKRNFTPEQKKKTAEYQKRYRAEHIIERKQKQAEWYRAHQDEIKAYRERNDDKIRAYRRKYNLLRQYGITIEDYDLLLKKQNGKCAICGTTEPGNRSNNFSVDHDHITGKIRGLLCNDCNRGLGLLKDNAGKAAKYLRGTS